MVAGRSEDIFGLCFAGELLGEDLALDVCVWSDIGDRQSYTLAHDLCVKVLTLDFLLHLSRHQFNWIGIGPVGLLVGFALCVPLVVDKVIVVDEDS